MNQSAPKANWYRWLLPTVLVWLLVASLLLLSAWPDIPRTGYQWALLLGLGPPLYLLSEAVCVWLSSPARGWAISRKRFSVVRIAIALPVALAWFALAWWFASLVGSPQ